MSIRTLARRVTALTAALTIGLVAAPVGVASAADPVGTPIPQTALSYQGDQVQEVDVPAGAAYARITAEGGGGGAGMASTPMTTPGGVGAVVTGYVAVGADEVLEIAVGGQGQTQPDDPIHGGWGNGADGGDGGYTVCENENPFATYSGGGGGATTVTRSGTTLVVAGGGGGGGGGNAECPPENDAVGPGGVGGAAGPVAQDGGYDPTNSVAGGKAGAAPTGAGTAGLADTTGYEGPGGGGGGGVAGGTGGEHAPSSGGAGGGGGGAGTSGAAGLVGATSAGAFESAAGSVTIDWYPSVSLTLTPDAPSITAGQSQAFTVALTDPDGHTADLSADTVFTSSDSTDVVTGATIAFTRAGSRTVWAVVLGQTLQTTVTVVAGPPVALVVDVPPVVYTGTQFAIAATRVDAEGNDLGLSTSAIFNTTDPQANLGSDSGEFTGTTGREATITAVEMLGETALNGSAQVYVSADLAYKRTVIASSSYEGPAWGAQLLTDGQTQSTQDHIGFTTNPADAVQDTDEWLYVDLAQTSTIGGVILSPRTTVATDPGDVDGAGYPQDFTIDVSDDAQNWTTLASYTAQSGANGPHHYSFAEPGTGRYLRVNATLLGPEAVGDDGYRLQLAGLQAYTTPPAAPPATLQLSVDGTRPEVPLVTVTGADAYRNPVGGLSCLVTLLSSVPSDSVGYDGCDEPITVRLDALTSAPRVFTAVLDSDSSVSAEVEYDPQDIDPRPLTSVTASVVSARYGAGTRIHVEVAESAGPLAQTRLLAIAAVPYGPVRVTEGGTELARGVLVDGSVDLTVDGGALAPGMHTLTVEYLGSDTHRPSAQTLVVQVLPATTTGAGGRPLARTGSDDGGLLRGVAAAIVLLTAGGLLLAVRRKEAGRL